MSDLFEIPPCESPRLRWIKKHQINTYCSGKAEDFDGEPWNCWQGKPEDCSKGHYETGATEHESIVNWAIKNNVRLWNEE